MSPAKKPLTRSQAVGTSIFGRFFLICGTVELKMNGFRNPYCKVRFFSISVQYKTCQIGKSARELKVD